MTPEQSPSDVDAVLSSYFLGPKGQNAPLWREMLGYVFDDYVYWRRNYFPDDASIITRTDQHSSSEQEWVGTLSTNLDRVLDNLKADYPFYSPRYIAHMLSDQTLPSVLGLFAGLLYNPNNVTTEAAPVSVAMELEVGDLLAKMVGLGDQSPESPSKPWGHLTSGGTVATLEALWVARQAQFVPIIVADCCRNESVRSSIMDKLKSSGHTLSDAAVETIGTEEVWSSFDGNILGQQQTLAALIDLAPEYQLRLLPRLKDHLLGKVAGDLQDSEKGAVQRDLTVFLKQAMYESRYNPAQQGYSFALSNLNEGSNTKLRRGVVFASEAAHYALEKACNILGYGSAGLRLIPVDPRFRLDTGLLTSALDTLSSEEYVAAVVGICGTTEEGAVDPLHEIVRLRRDREREAKGSFWIHVDAAWGGYLATVFDRNDVGDLLRTPDNDVLHVRAVPTPELRDKGISMKIDVPTAKPISKIIRWGKSGGEEDHVKNAFGAIRHADSVVIDPHKLGYVPYPSGALLFRDSRTTLLTAQTASYIGAGSDSGGDAFGRGDRPREVAAVGDYVIEGSKPGAAATSAWLAHKSIPLDAAGHGRIIRQTLLGAKKLSYLLRLHNSNQDIHTYCETNLGQTPLSIPMFPERRYHVGFEIVAEPDTNLVTFIARPLRSVAKDKPTFEGVAWTLLELNTLNNGIHDLMGRPHRPDQDAEQPKGDAPYPYGHPFFVSKTKMQTNRHPGGKYSFDSVKTLLERLLPSIPKHQELYDSSDDGLVALRCTVMSPYYGLAMAREQRSEDYLMEFVETIHNVALTVLIRMTEELASYVLVQCDPGASQKVAESIKEQRSSVRRAIPVGEEGEGNPNQWQRVLLEIRAPLRQGLGPAEAVRQLGSEIRSMPEVHRTETFVRTDFTFDGDLTVDSNPVAYLFLKVEAGHAHDVLREIASLDVRRGVVEIRIVTGRYDVVVAFAGVDPDETRHLVRKIVGKLKEGKYLFDAEHQDPWVLWSAKH